MYSLDSHLLNMNTLMEPKAGGSQEGWSLAPPRGSPSGVWGRDVYLLVSHSCSHSAEGLQLPNKESSQVAPETCGCSGQANGLASFKAIVFKYFLDIT